jgi:hypothetical protein
MARRRFDPLTAFGIPFQGGGIIRPAAGPEVWVNTEAEAFGTGATPDRPFETVAEAFTHIAAVGESNGVLYVQGDIREEATAPLGVYGWRIQGAVGGRPRHSTSGGVAVAGNGVNWREPASGATTGGALLTLLEQGWEVQDILFVPKSDGTALRLSRRESASIPDASHAVIRGCKFIGAATATCLGIEDDGGCHHVLVELCEFNTLDSGIVNTSATIANPLRWMVRNNIFMNNDEHIDMPFTESVVLANVFDEATTNVETDGGAGGNFVIDNYFQEDQASITNGNGYAGHANDVWRNFSQNTAAVTVGTVTS